MDEVVEAFVQAPSEALLDGSTRDQLVKIAAHYNVDVGDKRVKETVKANLKLTLFKINVLSAGEAASISAGAEGATPPLVVGLDAGLSFFKQQKELLVLRMQLESECGVPRATAGSISETQRLRTVLTCVYFALY